MRVSRWAVGLATMRPTYKNYRKSHFKYSPKNNCINFSKKCRYWHDFFKTGVKQNKLTVDNALAFVYGFVWVLHICPVCMCPCKEVLCACAWAPVQGVRPARPVVAGWPRRSLPPAAFPIRAKHIPLQKHRAEAGTHAEPRTVPQEEGKFENYKKRFYKN